MRLILILTAAVSLLLAGCPAGRDDDGRVSVVASFYPLAEAARRVGGDLVTVADLTPAGAEPHDLEPTTDQVDAILDADLVVYLGSGFQPSLEQAVEGRDGPTLDALVQVTEAGERTDPHVWLDPRLMMQMVDAVSVELQHLDPANAEGFGHLASVFQGEIDRLDGRYRQRLSDCERDLVVTAHDAFGHLADRYQLRVESIAGISPEAEPDPERLAELADLVRDQGVTTIFTEELVSPDVAETLAREAGVRTEVLSPIESLTAAQQAEGEDYVSLMDANLQKLADALGCR
ncbi:MAG: zinc ABC transporter substrate-binding protein [Actinobacteria bacterium]|nr:zinc ABC transporter substrate-binding protein [Actinomycetota bacterium]